MTRTVGDLLEHHRRIIFNIVVIKCVIAWHLNVNASWMRAEQRKMKEKNTAIETCLNIRLKLYIIRHICSMSLRTVRRLHSQMSTPNERALHFRRNFLRSHKFQNPKAMPRERWWKSFFFHWVFSSNFLFFWLWWEIFCLNIWIYVHSWGKSDVILFETFIYIGT